MVIFCSRLSAHNPAGNPPLSAPVAFSRRKLKTLFVESWPRPWKRKRKEGELFPFVSHAPRLPWLDTSNSPPSNPFVNVIRGWARFSPPLWPLNRGNWTVIGKKFTIFRELLSPSFLDRKAKINLHIISLLVSRPPFLCCARKKDKNDRRTLIGIRDIRADVDEKIDSYRYRDPLAFSLLYTVEIKFRSWIFFPPLPRAIMEHEKSRKSLINHKRKCIREETMFTPAIYGSINFYIRHTHVSLLAMCWSRIFLCPASFVFSPSSWNYTFQNTGPYLWTGNCDFNRWTVEPVLVKIHDVKTFPATNPWNDRFSVKKRTDRWKRGEEIKRRERELFFKSSILYKRTRNFAAAHNERNREWQREANTSAA